MKNKTCSMFLEKCPLCSEWDRRIHPRRVCRRQWHCILTKNVPSKRQRVVCVKCQNVNIQCLSVNICKKMVPHDVRVNIKTLPILWQLRLFYSLIVLVSFINLKKVIFVCMLLLRSFWHETQCYCQISEFWGRCFQIRNLAKKTLCTLLTNRSQRFRVRFFMREF